MSDINSENVTLPKPKIVYVYDAMCGWCFGFSNVIYNIFQNYKDDFDFEVLSGGMIIGDGVTPAYKMKDFILKAYTRVEQISGAKFGEPYLELFREGSYMLNSELASIVITAVKELRPDFAFEIVKDIQYAHFVLGHSLNSMITFENILNKKGFNLTEFNRFVMSEEVRNKTYEEFAFVKKLGITGFPALLLLHNGKYYSISSGFTKYEDINEVMQSIVNNIKDIK